MRHLLIIIILATFIISGCSKSFLDKYPKDQQTEATAFTSYDNFKTYSWNLYSVFTGYGNNEGADDPVMLQGERYSDNMGYGSATNSNSWALLNQTVPNTGGGWDFSFIRSANLMLDNIDKSSMAQTDKDHWRSVGYLFRAVRYMQLLSRFGDVPWLEHVVKDNDVNVLYAPRDPRDTVAARILRNLVWAESHIKTAGDGTNTVNVHVVRAILSRFGLFEGTWRKYHNLPDANVYLQACIDYSKPLLASYPTIGSTIDTYDLLFNKEDLTGYPGVILFKAYATGQNVHGFTRYTMTSSWYYDLTRDAVESYLCSNGNPIRTSPGYSDTSMYAEFRNRDRRLYMTVMPPYKVVTTGNNVFSFTANPADREYIDTMSKIVGASTKTLPASNWNRQYLDVVPHFRTLSFAYCASRTGFYMWKFYNKTTPTDGTNNTNDCPILHIEEAMLNYAEAMWEMGQFDQSVADLTINKLRVRANVTPMVVANINAAFDPARDQSIDPVLWEIRRERRVELMGEGFRFDDLRRWDRCNYMKDHSELGVYIKQSDYPVTAAKVAGGASQGYVQYFDLVTGNWPDYYYLYPLPSDQLMLNTNLKQNDGWH